MIFPQHTSLHVPLSLSCPHRHHPVQDKDSELASTLLGSQEEPLLPPIFVMLRAFDACFTLRTILSTFPAHLHYAIKASLIDADPYQHLRLQILELLVGGLRVDTVVQRIGAVSPVVIFQHPCVFGLIEGMLANASTYRRELAFFFALLPIDRLPHPLHLKLALFSLTLSGSVLPAYCSWYVCGAAEERLQQAMQDQAVLLVNGVILLKFYGKLSGVAVQSALLTDGTQLIAGCWYAPIDQREEIRAAFDRGESRWSGEGQWALLRDLDDPDDTLLQSARTYADTLPPQLPQQIGGFSSRQAYRSCRHEAL